MTDYERLYAEQDDVCGDPFPEFVGFFEGQPPGLSVLDVGCGQGRDALVAARLGHRVVGVDLSPTGVAQMRAKAAEAGLSVEGIVADIVDFQPEERFGVVLIDRVLHMLPDDELRLRVFTRLAGCVEPGGHLLVADTPQNVPAIRASIEDAGDAWTLTFARKGFLFWQRAREAT